MNGIKQIRARFMAATVVIATGLLTSTLAMADHIQPDYPNFILDHNVPATVCQVWGGDYDIADSARYSQFGRLQNNHPSEKLGVVCPISKNPQTSLAQLFVYVTDNSPQPGGRGSIGCRLRKMSAHTDNVNFSQADNTEGLPGGVGKDTLHFNFVEHIATDGVSEHFVLFCTIPAMGTASATPSSIDSIRIMEDEHPMQ